MKKYFTKTKFNLGDKINNWEIQSQYPIRKFGRSYIKVKCTCGSELEKEIPISHVISNLSKGCEKCSRFHTSKGLNLISGSFWKLIESGAKKRNIKFLLTIEEAWQKYIEQKGKCALTGIPIKFELNQVHHKGIDNRITRTASLDRIDSSLGYNKENIQWVHKDINIMKNKFKQEYFLKMCKLICKKN